ncbi:MAG: diphthamide biosynthesis enzyme Dph2 [Candidatus Thermoplasmatota archaeon]|jgi:2-(3-amino-3-carboxypropyl)histidine synthase|nr:diphthamide biosynthesis enzyme Dph2 [Candidatus Thermoplasmatota archaeon]MCL5791095.1 diphthamide biosynthesis enzyme Dph2 [Candidatus Thermoplasmatota archaeon]
MTNYMDPGRVISRLKEMGAKRILLQLPDGLKPHVFDYFNELSRNFQVIVSSEGFFGACDTGTMDEYKGVDAVVQMGHTEIPNVDYGIPVIFEEYIHPPRDDFDGLDQSPLRNSGYRKIGILYSIQYRESAMKFREFLERNGFETSMGENDGRLKYPGQVLGCNYSPIHSNDRWADCHIILSTGTFHSMGAQLVTDKEVFLLDMSEPFSLHSMRAEADKRIRLRYANMARAMDAKKFVIVVDTKVGQFRIKLAEKIRNEIEDMGRSAIIAYANESNPIDFQNMRPDCIIFTGCPRVATDDFMRYETPIMTAQEFQMIFKGKGNGKYIFDEIVNVDRIS